MVISIIGPQSTGKSTLLNFLFGTSFQMSAGRCTRGLYASLFETNYPNAKNCLVLDIEGILAIEKNDEKFDKKLCIFAMAMSHVLIINVMGEINESMKKVLEISLYCGKQIVCSYGEKPILFFALRNMQDDNVDKQIEMINHISKSFKDVANFSNVDLKEVLDYRDQDSFCLFLSAFNKDIIEELNKTPVCTINSSFRNKCDKFKDIIFKEAQNIKRKMNLLKWIDNAKTSWSAINDYDDILMVKDLKEIQLRAKYGSICKEIIDNLIHNKKNKDSLLYKLEQCYKNQMDLVDEDQQNKLLQKDNIQLILKKITQNFESELEVNFDKKLDDQDINQPELRNEYYKNLDYNCEIMLQETYDQLKIKFDQLESANLIQQSINEIEYWIYEQSKQQQNNSQQWEKFELDLEQKFEKKFKQVYKQIYDKLYKFKDEENLKCRYEIIDIFDSYQKNNCTKAQFVLHSSYILKEQNQKVKKQNLEKIQFIQKILILRSYYIKQNLQNSQYQNIGQLHEEVFNLLEKCLKNNKKYKEYYQQRIQGIQNISNNKVYDIQGRPMKDDKDQSKLQIFKNWVKKYSGYNYFFSNNYELQPQAQINDVQTILKIQRTQEKQDMMLFLILEIGDIFNKLEIDKQKKVDRPLLSQYIEQINKWIKQTEGNQLSSTNFEFSTEFYRYLTLNVNDICIDINLKHIEAQKQYQLNQFYQKKNELKKQFKNKIQSIQNDLAKVEDLAFNIIQNVKSYIKKENTDKIIDNIRGSSQINEQILTDECDTLFQDNLNDEILSYVKDSALHMQKEFNKKFDKIKQQQIDQILQKETQTYKQYIQNIICSLKQLEMTLKPINSNKNAKDEQFRIQLYQYMIYYLIQKEDQNQQCSKIEEQNQIFKEFNIQQNQNYALPKQCIFYNKKEQILDGQIKEDISRFFLLFIEALQKEQNIQQIKIGYDQNYVDEASQTCKNNNRAKAVGCIEHCPYCGAKCKNGQGQHSKHYAQKHRPMAFRGVWEQLQGKKPQFVFSICDSKENIDSLWMDISQEIVKKHKEKMQIMDSQLKQRLTKDNITFGKLNFTLEWSDPNDLDLHVICPCETHIHYSNRKCNQCGGYLDLDMNYGSNNDAIHPVEHVYFNDQVKSGVYKYYVHYYSGPKEYQGIKGGDNSEYKITIHDEQDKVIQKYTGSVSTTNQQQDYVHVYDKGISFNTHCQKLYPDWQIQLKNDVDDKSFNESCKNAWNQIYVEIGAFYNKDSQQWN